MFGEMSAARKVRPTLFYDEAVLGSAFDIKAADGGTPATFVNTGLNLTIPFAGTYMIGINVRAHIQMAVAVSGYIVIKLYRSDTATYVTNSERFCIIDDATGGATFLNRNIQNESGYTIPITLNSACVITLYAKRDGSATNTDYATVDIQSDGNGRTSLNYIKIG